RHRGEVHKPTFWLHEVLDLWTRGARAHVMGDPQERRVVDRTARAAARALSRSAGSNAWRAAAVSLSYCGSLMKPQLFEVGGAILLSSRNHAPRLAFLFARLAPARR